MKIKIITRILEVGIILFIIVFIYIMWSPYAKNIEYDEGIKPEIAGLRASGELYKADKGSFFDFCNSQEANKVRIMLQGENLKFICDDNESEWAACANNFPTIKKYKGIYHCADSKGEFLDIKGTCDENWKYTQCPKN